MNKKQLMEILDDPRISDNAQVAMECLESEITNYVGLIKIANDSSEIRLSDDWKVMAEIVAGENEAAAVPAERREIVFIKDENNEEINFSKYYEEMKINGRRMMCHGFHSRDAE